MKTRKMDWKPGRNSKIAGSSRRTQIYTELMLLLGLTFFVEPVQMARLIPYLQRSSKSCCSGLQYMFNCPVIFRNLKTLLIYSLVKYFWRIFEISVTLSRCMIWNFLKIRKAFELIMSSESDVCWSAPMTDVSLSGTSISLYFINLNYNSISASIYFRETFLLSALWFFEFLIKFLELWTSKNLGIGTSVSIKPVDKLLLGGEYLSGCRIWMVEHTTLSYTARRRYPQWGSAHHEDPNTINKKLA